MSKETLTHDDFLQNVPPDLLEYVEEMHKALSDAGCTYKLKEAKSGPVLSWVWDKKTVANLVFRKKGILCRIYGDHIDRYEDVLTSLPEVMKKKIAKAGSCKRLLNPEDCNSRCPMGYSFMLDGQYHQLCRYAAFEFLLDGESYPFLEAFILREVRERTAG